MSTAEEIVKALEAVRDNTVGGSRAAMVFLIQETIDLINSRQWPEPSDSDSCTGCHCPWPRCEALGEPCCPDCNHVQPERVEMNTAPGPTTSEPPFCLWCGESLDPDDCAMINDDRYHHPADSTGDTCYMLAQRFARGTEPPERVEAESREPSDDVLKVFGGTTTTLISDIIDALGDWHDEGYCDGPQDLIDEIKAMADKANDNLSVDKAHELLAAQSTKGKPE